MAPGGISPEADPVPGPPFFAQILLITLKKELLNQFRAIKRKSRIQAFLYLIQRL
jgi:hypothetical protein